MDSKTLALYLGCEAELRTSSGYLQVSKLNDVDLRDNTVVVGDEWGDASNVRLLLRPLSSMTEEESQEFLSISWYNKNGKFTKDEIEMFMKPPHHYSTESFLWLLSKGFDLFGLIEKGEAFEHVSETLRR